MTVLAKPSPDPMRKRVLIMAVTGDKLVVPRLLSDFGIQEGGDGMNRAHPGPCGWGYVDIEFFNKRYRLLFENKPDLPRN